MLVLVGSENHGVILELEKIPSPQSLLLIEHEKVKGWFGSGKFMKGSSYIVRQQMPDFDYNGGKIPHIWV